MIRSLRTETTPRRETKCKLIRRKEERRTSFEVRRLRLSQKNTRRRESHTGE